MKYRFQEGELELRSGDCCLRNQKGVLVSSWKYEPLMPFIDRYSEDHRIRNFFATATACLVWSTILFCCFTIPREVPHLIGTGIIALIPLTIGCYFFRLRKKSSVTYAFTDYRTDKVYTFTCSKESEQTKEFITALNTKLQERSGLISYLKEHSEPVNPARLLELKELQIQGVLSPEEFLTEKQRYIETVEKLLG